MRTVRAPRIVLSLVIVSSFASAAENPPDAPGKGEAYFKCDAPRLLEGGVYGDRPFHRFGEAGAPRQCASWQRITKLEFKRLSTEWFAHNFDNDAPWWRYDESRPYRLTIRFSVPDGYYKEAQHVERELSKRFVADTFGDNSLRPEPKLRLQPSYADRRLDALTPHFSEYLAVALDDLFRSLDPATYPRLRVLPVQLADTTVFTSAEGATFATKELARCRFKSIRNAFEYLSGRAQVETAPCSSPADMGDAPQAFQQALRCAEVHVQLGALGADQKERLRLNGIAASWTFRAVAFLANVYREKVPEADLSDIDPIVTRQLKSQMESVTRDLESALADRRKGGGSESASRYLEEQVQLCRR